MLENMLRAKQMPVRLRVTVQGAVSLLVVALAVALPQLVHAVAGAEGGMRYMPMYLPVLLGGCLLGTWWGLGIGVLSPVVSFLITYAAGAPMPALSRLPYMMAEMAVFAAVSGGFSKSIAQNGWMAFPAALLAAVGGRAVFLALAAAFGAVSPLSAAVAWEQVQLGLTGLVLQAVLVPLAVMGLRRLLARPRKQTEQNEHSESKHG